MRPSRFTATLIGLASALTVAVPALAQMPGGMNHEGHQGMPGMMNMPGMSAPAGSAPAHAANAHDVGPAGATYDLRWLDAMVQHHTGALRMSEFVFDIGVPGVGALGKDIWRDQAQEIKAMGQWRKAWYPEAQVYPVVLKTGGDPNAMADLIRMSPSQIQAMQNLVQEALAAGAIGCSTGLYYEPARAATTEEVIEVRRGRKIKSERRFFPGYVLVKMEMTDQAYHLIKNTPKVTGFLGSDNKPMPISEAEAELLLTSTTIG